MFVRIFCTNFKRNVHQFHTHRRFTMKIHHSLTGFFFALKHCMQCNIGLDTFLRICKLFIPELKKTSAAVSQPSAATTSLYRKRNQPYFYFHHFDHHESAILTITVPVYQLDNLGTAILTNNCAPFLTTMCPPILLSRFHHFDQARGIIHYPPF